MIVAHLTALHADGSIRLEVVEAYSLALFKHIIQILRRLDETNDYGARVFNLLHKFSQLRLVLFAVLRVATVKLQCLQLLEIAGIGNLEAIAKLKAVELLLA